VCLGFSHLSLFGKYDMVKVYFYDGKYLAKTLIHECGDFFLKLLKYDNRFCERVLSKTLELIPEALQFFSKFQMFLGTNCSTMFILLL
jgi:hypothetical protein